MSLAIVYSRAQCGIDAPLVIVEAHLSNGLSGLSIVGLPEAAVKESKDRVRSAIINSHFEFPDRRIIINLAPADLPKEGGRFDLPIALGILAASDQIPTKQLMCMEFIGELALTGELRPVKGSLTAAIKATQQGRELVVPLSNANEAALCKNATILPACKLLTLSAHLYGRETINPYRYQANDQVPVSYPDLADVRGQAQAKRALEITAAGGHNLIMTGAPGTGKTMLASRLPGILPPLTEQEALEQAAIQSVTQYTQQASPGDNHSNWQLRPFRAPHHTASAVALVGGGNPPKPGEISLAHNGVLFLDELPEYPRHVLEVLREPMESGQILISRANNQTLYPARFQLLAAMNPCPCGYYGESGSQCECTNERIRKYRSKVSGPLLDRMDMHLKVSRVPHQLLAGPDNHNTEASENIRQRVIKARDLQLARQAKPNSQISVKEIPQYCRLAVAEQQFLDRAMEKLKLSARSYHRILRVARTIADLTQASELSSHHLKEALSFRQLDGRR